MLFCNLHAHLDPDLSVRQFEHMTAKTASSFVRCCIVHIVTHVQQLLQAFIFQVSLADTRKTQKRYNAGIIIVRLLCSFMLVMQIAALQWQVLQVNKTSCDCRTSCWLHHPDW